jgi:hydrogenase/urease accessory protein HupE
MYRSMFRITRLQFASLVWLAALIVYLSPAESQAHTIRPAVTTMVLTESNVISVQIRTNAEVLMAGISPEYSDTNDAPNAEQYTKLRQLPAAELANRFAEFADIFLDGLTLKVDRKSIPLTYLGIEVPKVDNLELARDSIVHLQTTIPANSDSLSWLWPEQYGSNVLRINREGSTEIVSAWLKQGETSQPYPLSGAPAEISRLDVALNYVAIGFEHIVPKGTDHILFVIGIFLLSIHLRPLLWQVTAFTLAHTLTLGLSIYGVISAPASLVEPLIALSIAYIGIENCLSSKLQPWRVVLVFCFGLLHGMGFAGVLTEIGLPRSEFVTALITFNVGVELGQLVVILIAFLLLGWWRNAVWYRSRIVIPLSVLISAIGLYWTWERIFG